MEHKLALQPARGAALPCPVCGAHGGAIFFELTDMPVCIGRQWASRAEAQSCRRGDIRLAFCDETGLIWNQAFDPADMDYNGHYDNSLDHSQRFCRYAADLAQRLVTTYKLRNKDVIEIGCGKGGFLSQLCAAGCKRAYGFDPSYEAGRSEGQSGGRLSVVMDCYSEKYSDIRGDLVCCRHVFEHLAEPVQFLRMIRRSIGNRFDTVVYFEVPNARFILDRLSIWDVVYEHCNYFSVESLRSIFQKCDFEVLRLEECYDGQFLGVEARPARTRIPETARPDVKALKDSALAFASQADARLREWQQRLDAMAKTCRRVVLWGAGAKAVGFLNMLRVGDQIPAVVDINPYKHRRHLAGTGQKIVPPEFLAGYRPHMVILMNDIYRDEVAAQLAGLGVEARIITA